MTKDKVLELLEDHIRIAESQCKALRRMRSLTGGTNKRLFEWSNRLEVLKALKQKVKVQGLTPKQANKALDALDKKK